MRDPRTIAYGRASAESAGPAVTLADGVMLRLAHGPYPFDEPPDLVGNATTAARLGLLRDHLSALCGPWERLAQHFVAAYFAWIAAAIEGAQAELVARSTLFAPEDWSFAAPRPLPQAHLPHGDAATARVDFAFWTGDRFIAVDLQSAGNRRRQRAEELAALEAAGVTFVRVPGNALQKDGAALLAQILPAPFQRFWAGVDFPASPFGAEALANFG